MERLQGGERAAALSVYGDLAERLRRTLGVAPSAATRALAAPAAGWRAFVRRA